MHARRSFTLALATAAALLVAVRRLPRRARWNRSPAKKLITIAIPTDFPPYGFVGTDLKPQGLDIDMAQLIAAKLGVKVELVPVTSANRIPYLQTKKADLVISTLGKNPEREKVIDFTAAYSPFFQAVFGAEERWRQERRPTWPARRVGVTRGAIEDHGADQDRAGRRRRQALRGQQRHRSSAFVSGQVQVIATGASVAGNMMAQEPAARAPSTSCCSRTRPTSSAWPRARTSCGSRSTRSSPTPRRTATLDKMALKWLGRPAGDLPN